LIAIKKWRVNRLNESLSIIVSWTIQSFASVLFLTIQLKYKSSTKRGDDKESSLQTNGFFVDNKKNHRGPLSLKEGYQFN